MKSCHLVKDDNEEKGFLSNIKIEIKKKKKQKSKQIHFVEMHQKFERYQMKKIHLYGMKIKKGAPNYKNDLTMSPLIPKHM